MPEWKDSYPSGISYQRNVFNILSPAHLQFCLAMAGQAGCDLDKPFTYVELGAGFGLSCAAWAAQYPHAEFHSVDFNPLHTAFTSELAQKAGLSNLTVHEASIGDMLQADLPQFDFIVMHGVYSWVSEQGREDIHAFMEKYLKQGACAYIGYNALPGSKDIDPMRLIIHENIANLDDCDHVEAMQQGFKVLQDLQNMQAKFFTYSPQAGAKLSFWVKDQPEYLVGEIMPAQHRSFYFAELQKRLAKQDISWVCSADSAQFLKEKNVSEDFKKYLKESRQNLVWQETLKDFQNNTTFRYDLFLRGADAEKKSADSILEDSRFCLDHIYDPFPEEVSQHGMRIGLRKEIYEPLQALLASGPLSLDQIAGLMGMLPRHSLQVLSVLIALDWVRPALSMDSAEVSRRVQKFNLALHDILGKDMSMPVLSAAGGWVKNRDPLAYHYIIAALEGKDIGEYIINMLRDDPSAEQHEAGLAAKELDVEKAVARYLAASSGEMDLFLDRHRLKDSPDEA